MTAVPQQAFASGSRFARAAVTVNAREIASAPVNARASVAPTQNSVYGIARQYRQPCESFPAAVMSRPIVAKGKYPSASSVLRPGNKRLPRIRDSRLPARRCNTCRPRITGAGRPTCSEAGPPGKPATATAVKPGTPPPGRPAGNQPASRLWRSSGGERAARWKCGTTESSK